ncbi:type VI secretion system membrane subunit TssM [Sulfurimonas sp. MAG313]|nr:type VI secretion system membrane subunit TssM [Sulfurimonas sp. MAG313]MDF1880499.1 type VI secretion system membrane subunit TssM [Sulfurimonas sp. MAG313]
MSKFQKNSIFKKPSFWILSLSFIVAIFILFATPYLFEGWKDLTLRLLVSFSLFFGPVLLILLYTLFVKEEVKQKIRDKQSQFKRKKEYSGVIGEKVADLKTRFNEAMRIIKSSSIYKNKQSAGYELPWYLMVGAETEGKTSMLENSGLDFPLNINYEKRSVTEAGATKSFQWYFAEHAIFIDMPGNYISSTRSEEDLALWETFLRLFSKKRWKRPINGIMLTISVDTLMEKNEKELEQYAKDLRDRFDEIAHAFNSNIPIYLLVSKTDKITGFTEYFSSINDDEKDEVLGVTFDEQAESIDTSIIQPELEALLQRLNTSVLDKVNREWDTGARAKILLFCNEFSALFEKLNMFVDIGFAQTRYRKPLMLRGIYFTSVPHGNTLPVAQEFEESSLASMQAQKGMFIQKLLSDIIFPEADIIKMDTNYKKNQRVKHMGAIAASVVIVAFSTIYWIQDFNSRLDSLDSSAVKMLEYDKERDVITSRTDFAQVLVSLNKIEKLKSENEEEMGNHIWQLAYFKVADRNSLIESHYKEALEDILLPRIAEFIEGQIAASIGNYDSTWESTKAYSMLHNEDRRDKDFLKGWLATAWSHLYPNMNATQNDLNRHFSKLLEYGFAPYNLKEETLTLARNQLLEFGHEALVYKELKDVAKEKNLKDFRFSTALGSYASAFEGSDHTIPGFYTKKGFESIIIKDGKALIKDLVANNWVVGYSTDLSDSELNEMYAKVQNYYFIDYKKYWTGALTALAVPNYKSISEINNQLTVLTSGTSPIIGVLQALKENTMIYTPAEKLQMQAESTAVNGKVAAIASQHAIEKAKKITKNTSVKNIREYFSTYNRLLDKENKPTPKLATAMSKLNNVYQEMTAIYGSVSPEKDAYKIVLDRISGRHEPIIMPISALPRPVDQWFKKALKNDWAYLLSRTKKYINHQYRMEVLGYYNDKIKGRYPLTKKSNRNDIRLENFEEFFKKDGIMDIFYQNYVATFVNLDIRRGTYRYRTIDGSNMYINKNFMNAMLSVEDIRKTLFTSKGDFLGTSLYLKPRSLGRKLARMEYHYDDNYIAYEHGPIKSRQIKWPAESLNNITKFSMYNLQKDRVVEDAEEGEWGLFKLIDKFIVKSHTKRRGTDSVVIEYKKQRYDGSFTLTGMAAKLFTKDNPLKNFRLSNGL